MHGDHAADAAGPPAAACADCRKLMRELHHQDLFLALACALGDRIAWEFFADEFMPLLKRFAGQACRGSDVAQDLAQEMISSLFGQKPDGTQTVPAPQGSLAATTGAERSAAGCALPSRMPPSTGSGAAGSRSRSTR